MQQMSRNFKKTTSISRYISTDNPFVEPFLCIKSYFTEYAQYQEGKFVFL
jgi:hypothetical protein